MIKNHRITYPAFRPSRLSLVLLMSALITILSLAHHKISLADSWFPPTPITTVSNMGEYRLTIFPSTVSRKTSDRLDCEAVLEKLDGRRYQTLWRKPLANDISPAAALISDDGHLVTFDNWGQIGIGSNVIVIYDANGQMLRRLGLEELFTKQEITKLPRTSSSVLWRRGQQLSNNGLLVVTLASGDELHLNIKDGMSLPQGVK